MTGLTKNIRRRAAIMIAVAYVFCVMAPTVALAVVAGPASFNCTDELNATGAPKQVGMVHSHTGAMSNHHEQSNNEQSGAPGHHSDNGDKKQTGNCCGLFCISALTQDFGVTFGVSAPASSSVAAIANGLTGCAPPPSHRPPIA